jgi:hypothetical protein
MKPILSIWEIVVVFALFFVIGFVIAFWELESEPPAPETKEIMVNAASLDRLTPQCIEGTIKYLDGTCYVLCEVLDEEADNNTGRTGSARTLDYEVGDVDGDASRKTEVRTDI